MDERTHPKVHLHRLAGRETVTPGATQPAKDSAKEPAP